MKPDTDLVRLALETAALSGINIPPEDLTAVAGIFSNLARVASPLLAFELPEEMTAAPVFVPYEGEAE
jgi:hypothetical protein